MKVRCIDTKGMEDHLSIGKIYNAEKEDDGYIIKANDRGKSTWNFRHRFEEVNEMTKNDLVPGKHVVEYRCGKKAHFNGLTFSNGKGAWMPLSAYTEDLKDTSDAIGTHNYDIVAVYEVEYASHINIMIDYAKEVWRRNDNQEEYDKLMKQIDELKAQAEKLKP